MREGTDLQASLAAMRPVLIKLAMQQLKNRALAEDVVSETILVALEQAGRFRGQSKPRTWVIGILKHKIVDQLRRQAREVSLDAPPYPGDTAAPDAQSVVAPDDGLDATPEWADPERVLGRKQFSAVMQTCLARLPQRLSRVFVMREWLDYSSAEVCRLLGITMSNCNVMLFRARERLRTCLSCYWPLPSLSRPTRNTRARGGRAQALHSH